MIQGERVLTPAGPGTIVKMEKIGDFARGALVSHGRWWAAVKLDSGGGRWWTLEELRPESAQAKSR